MANENTELRGQVAIVTGAAGGIGRSIAATLATAGAHTVLVDVADCRDVAEVCRAQGVESLSFRRSVTSEEDMQRTAEETLARFGSIDILVNNAGGVIGLGIAYRPLEEFPEADWHKVVALNLTGSFLATKAVLAAMKRQRSGKIVFISSGAARGTSDTHVHAYTAAKAGVLGLMRELAWEMGPYGVNVNAVCPGFTMSSQKMRDRWAALSPSERDAKLSRLALHRTGSPEEIADAVLFLCTGASRFITGQALGVDGGQWMI
jgi:3-oxoacyl-[acyl-carrier protein] reductase